MEQLQIAEKETDTPELESNFTETQQELLTLLGSKLKRGLKKYYSLAVLVILLIAALISWRFFSNRENTEDAVTFRKYTVQRGDVIVFSSESSSISLSRETVKFPVSTMVEEVFVKVGQSVKKGDPLI